MGLLDIIGLGSESFKNRREDELAQRLTGLIGQRGESAGNGPMAPQGILGGNPTPEQFSTQAGQAMLGVPGYEQYGTNMINQMTANRQSGFNNMNTVQGAMDRHMAMSPAQQATLNQNQFNQNQGYLYKEMDQAYKNEELYRNNTEMASNILGSMDDGTGTIDYKNTNGVQHNQLVVTLAKSILGNEAVNVDDRGAIILAGGAPGYLSSMVAKVNGGQLGESDFYNVVNQLQHNIATGLKRNSQMRARTLGRINARGGNESWMPTPVTPVQRYRLAGEGSDMSAGLIKRYTGSDIFEGNDDWERID